MISEPNRYWLIDTSIGNDRLRTQYFFSSTDIATNASIFSFAKPKSSSNWQQNSVTIKYETAINYLNDPYYIYCPWCNEINGYSCERETYGFTSSANDYTWDIQPGLSGFGFSLKLRDCQSYYLGL